MNKYIFIYLLSLMILNIQSKSCSAISTAAPPEETQDEEPNPDGKKKQRRQLESCSDADQVKGYNCVSNGSGGCKQESKCPTQPVDKCGEAEVPTGYKCEKKDSKCDLVSTATNSSKILNIFKTTFALLIVLTIL